MTPVMGPLALALLGLAGQAACAALIQVGGTPLAAGTSQGEVSVVLERASGGDTPVLTLRSDRGPLRLLLDTGASSTLVTPALVDRLGLRSRPVDPASFTLAGAGQGCPELRPARVGLPELVLANNRERLRLSGLEALVLPAAGLPPDVDGVLGAPQLRQQPLWIDPHRNRVSLGRRALRDAQESDRNRRGSPAGSATTLTLTWRKGVPLLPLQTPGGTTPALADTGAEGLFVTAALAKRLRPMGPPQGLKLAGFCGEQPARRQRLGGLSLPGGAPGATDAAHEAIVTDNPVFTSLQVEAIVGQELLRRRSQLWRLEATPATLTLWP